MWRCFHCRNNRAFRDGCLMLYLDPPSLWKWWPRPWPCPCPQINASREWWGAWQSGMMLAQVLSWGLIIVRRWRWRAWGMPVPQNRRSHSVQLSLNSRCLQTGPVWTRLLSYQTPERICSARWSCSCRAAQRPYFVERFHWVIQHGCTRFLSLGPESRAIHSVMWASTLM